MSFSRGERAEGRAHSSMEIAPIAGVRAVSLQRQPKTADASQPQFKIDASERTEDDTYSPDREEKQNPAEEGTQIGDTEDSSPAEATHPLPEGSTIDLIA
jgi:hypothetical protein